MPNVCRYVWFCSLVDRIPIMILTLAVVELKIKKFGFDFARQCCLFNIFS